MWNVFSLLSFLFLCLTIKERKLRDPHTEDPCLEVMTNIHCSLGCFFSHEVLRHTSECVQWYLYRELRGRPTLNTDNPMLQIRDFDRIKGGKGEFSWMWTSCFLCFLPCYHVTYFPPPLLLGLTEHKETINKVKNSYLKLFFKILDIVTKNNSFTYFYPEKENVSSDKYGNREQKQPTETSPPQKNERV